MGVAKYDHQPGDQPARHDANLLDNALLNPEEELIRFLKQAPRSHRALSPAVPPQVTLLLFSRLLQHGLQPTISAPHRSSSPCRVAQRSPSAGSGHKVDLAIECPLSPLLPNSIAHQHQ